MTIFGTRPEIIRLSLVLKMLDEHCEHITVHTGQNFHESLSDIFLRDLDVRQPDEHLGIRSKSFGDQIGQILSKTDEVLEKHTPDKVLILGDTNSALSAIVAARRGIPVFHMEAGNRCYDDRVPEEVNRRIIDHSSSVLLPYTYRSKENLVREGIERERIFVSGNPIKQVLDAFAHKIDASTAISDLKVQPLKYFLATLHRAENVDIEERLVEIFDGLEKVAKRFEMPVLVSVHPRTSERLKTAGLSPDPDLVRLIDAMGFFDFVKLEKNAFGVLTDSGTVQEECCIFGVPNVTVRDVTERPETIECGSNILSGGRSEVILDAAEIAVGRRGSWTPPAEYLAENVAETVVNIVLGFTNLKRYSS
ncbi:MAG TPA: UDP-N-acetylglucosamine 2-epimerase (non-hydrolyzing) [Pyrinomonadaceae bacterium]|nr:UDP-N-acetylglucosamine 2-epimerase (non-hydrolyzing) [Pyrinomonadaceae bacterium]